MLKKNRTQSENSKKKFDSWVFVRNALCMFKMIPWRVYVKIHVPHRTKNPCSK